MRCHYLKDGTVNFAFTMRRAEYFIPAGVLLKCFLETSDRELYDRLMAGAPPGSGHAAFLAERAELLLQHAAKGELRTRWGEGQVGTQRRVVGWAGWGWKGGGGPGWGCCCSTWPREGCSLVGGGLQEKGVRWIGFMMLCAHVGLHHVSEQ